MRSHSRPGCRYVQAIAFGCIPVFFRHGPGCGRALPLEELPGLPIAECSLTVDLAGLPHLNDTLAAIPQERRVELRVRSPAPRAPHSCS